MLLASCTALYDPYKVPYVCVKGEERKTKGLNVYE